MANPQNQYKDFVHEILTANEPRTPNPQHLDALLHWLAGRDTEPARTIQRAFDHHQASTDFAQRQTLNYLDRVLFAHDADPYRLFGLIPGCDFADIRARHKQLLQVFHPDRHQHHKDWFTRRSERLNHAYAHLKQNHGKQSTAQRTSASVVTTPTPGAWANKPRTPNPEPRSSNSQPRARSAPSATHLRARLKDHLGNAATLQQRVFIVLFTVPAVLLLVLYVNNQGSVEGGGIATIAENDQTPQTSETTASLVPRNPADLAGTPIPAPEPEPATSPADPEPGVDAATAEPEPLRIAGRTLDGPHNAASSDDVLKIDDGAPGDEPSNDGRAPGNESSTTKSEPGTQPEPESASTAAASQPTNESDREPTQEVMRTDNAEPSPERPDSEPGDTQQTAALDDAGTAATSDSTQAENSNEAGQTGETGEHADNPQTTRDVDSQPQEPELNPEKTETNDSVQVAQTDEAGQTDQAGERADNPQTTNDTESQPQDPEFTPEGETNIAQATTSAKETQSDSTTNHESPTTSHDSDSTEPTDTATPADAAPSDKTNHESPITNYDSDHRDNAQAVNALLKAYATAYRDSNINQFSALFQQNAETKHASGRREIKKKYGEFFQNTAERTVVFENVRIQLLGNRQFRVTAQYQAAWTYPNGRSKTESGRFQFHLTPDGDQLKIWRLNY